MPRRVVLERYLTSPLSVLAMWQPWATLCVAPDPEHGGAPAKPHETRSFRPRLALPIHVAIHATKSVRPEQRDAFADPFFKDALRRAGFYPGDPSLLKEGRLQVSKPTVPLGAIIGLATIVDVIPTGLPDAPARLRFAGTHEDDRHFGDYSPNRYAWQLDDVVQLPKPVPHSGRQDVFYPVPLEELELINEQLRDLKALHSAYSTPTLTNHGTMADLTGGHDDGMCV